jgi:hypothetical protein
MIRLRDHGRQGSAVPGLGEKCMAVPAIGLQGDKGLPRLQDPTVDGKALQRRQGLTLCPRSMSNCGRLRWVDSCHYCAMPLPVPDNLALATARSSKGTTQSRVFLEGLMTLPGNEHRVTRDSAMFQGLGDRRAAILDKGKMFQQSPFSSPSYR